MPRIEAYGVPLSERTAPKSGIDRAIMDAKLVERELDRRNWREPVNEDSQVPSRASVRLPKLSVMLEDQKARAKAVQID